MPPLAPEPLVGRSAELTHLTLAFAAATAGNGSLTLVLGDAGAGKTRLIDEFASALPPVSFAWGRAVENATVAYRPWRQRLKDRKETRFMSDRKQPSRPPTKPDSARCSARPALRYVELNRC